MITLCWAANRDNEFGNDSTSLTQKATKRFKIWIVEQRIPKSFWVFFGLRKSSSEQWKERDLYKRDLGEILVRHYVGESQIQKSAKIRVGELDGVRIRTIFK